MVPLKVRNINTCMRPLCDKCEVNPRAINYYLGDKIYYRKLCDACSRKKRNQKAHKDPLWKISGYKMKRSCEKCGFKAARPKQLTVYYLDNNKSNISYNNLKTVCLNCNYELSVTGWRIGDLQADL